MVLALGGGGLLLALALALRPESLDVEWGELAVVGVLGVLGFGSVAMAVARLVARIRFPVLPRPLE